MATSSLRAARDSTGGPHGQEIEGSKRQARRLELAFPVMDARLSGVKAVIVIGGIGAVLE
ncbi:hypothetical protein ACFO1B_43610 [Dactylosporangium siamense]|uniref:Uncharacterized protein n=1 Tax=Dactylosporangium siamense TaxID=685454 RepID=A0A919UHZ8_9ACTN|nr:hypothetical protein [Dactylosporangium siamense]GIG52901.1 hypothetical protein Dsi01nite_109420 [Dactylosporangium siamense]